jgi:PAS domain-containing protein
VAAPVFFSYSRGIMGTLHNLTIRTATAVGRFADLQRRAERVSDKPSPIAKAALAELSTALEELQVANEALQAQVDELSAVRSTIDVVQRKMEEFVQAVPVATVWTDRAGVIEKGNDAASQLLNIGKHHLQSKPLMLFITDRGALFAALRSLCDHDGVAEVNVDITVRPRERRPRRMKLCGRRLEHDTHCVWFIHDVPPAAREDAQESPLELVRDRTDGTGT